SKVYVTNNGAGTVTPIDVATNAAGSPITVGSHPQAVAFTPDGTKAYIANYLSNTVTPITVATDTAGSNIAVNSPDAIAITPDGAPDQAPVASFTVTPASAGSASSFDASASTVAYGAVTSYDWDFGDGNTATTTTPTTTHTYSQPGNYTSQVTETDSAGTSMTT